MSRTVDVTVAATTTASPEEAFDTIAPIDLGRIFDRWLLIPGVAGVRDQSGPWESAGRTRIVLLEDGSAVPEELTGVDRPHGFRYRVGPLPPPLGLIATSAEGEWTFTAQGGATRIEWTYRFRPARFRSPVVRLVIAPMWHGYARRALAEAVRIADAVKASRPES